MMTEMSTMYRMRCWNLLKTDFQKTSSPASAGNGRGGMINRKATKMKIFRRSASMTNHKIETQKKRRALAEEIELAKKMGEVKTIEMLAGKDLIETAYIFRQAFGHTKPFQKEQR